MKTIVRAGLGVLMLLSTAVVLGLGLLIYQGKQIPKADSPYVALGSSYAAGLGLGPRAPGSPLACQRSINGYPQQLARLTGLSLTDMSCSGATVANVLNGGQFFMGPQINAIGPDTKLVTLTAGGNDVDYVIDLFAMSCQHRGGVECLVIRHIWRGATPARERNFSLLESKLIATIHEILRRSPHAHVFVVTYPSVLPPTGTCPQLAIQATDVSLLRDVGTELAQVTRSAAQTTGVDVVDMASLSIGHDACSPEPWVNGATPERGAPFHPTFAGAKATAQQLVRAINTRP